MSKHQLPLIPPEAPLFERGAAASAPSTAPAKPEFVDNRELKLADALKAHIEWLCETYKNPVELSIATGYFNPEGFGLIANHLDRLSHVRLLLGAEPIPPPAKPVRDPKKDPIGERFETKLVNDALKLNADGLLRDRDRLDFAPATDASIRRLLEFLASVKIEVRRYEKRFLHGKAYLFSTDEGVLVGSSNFTAAGLTSNLELNLGRYDPAPVAKVRHWFDELWAEAAPYDLAPIYQARYEPYAPYLIYLRVLWERYKDELAEESAGAPRIRLTNFQNDGIFRAKRIAEKFNGVLIADGVGLGKTFIGGELLRQTVEERRQRALLITPAALRDSTWKRFADTHQLYMEMVSYEQLANDVQLGGTEKHLNARLNDYALVIIDEAQAFRNPDAGRAKALRTLLQGHPPKKLVLMSATPVNNSLWDLYYLLSYFIRHDAEFSGQGIRSLRERFADAMKVEPDALTPDVLFEILDSTTVRRTRHFVRRYYPHDRVIGPGGVEIAVTFPEPHVEAVNYSLDDVLPGFFDEFEDALAPSKDRKPKLTLARYSPSAYVRGGEQDLREAALVGLLRSGLLKRFESSAHAFALTAERMVKAHEIFLEGLDRGVILSPNAIEEWEQTDSDEALNDLIATSGSIDAEDYDVKRLRADVEADRGLLRDFAEKARLVTLKNDPKLKQLVWELIAILEQARKEAATDKEFRDKRKVIVFSYYADTVEWIYEYLADVLATDKRLAEYRGRLAAVSGEDSHHGVSRTKAVFGFTPESSEAPPSQTDDLFDILVTTDVLAEGMNLQQCRNIINYDLPWNPMRLVQRHGRIDRIGSPHRDVFIRCFFPDKRLESLLELEARIRRKVAQAAASVGVEGEVIPGSATAERVFSDTREAIEKLRKEDSVLFVNAGEDPSAHSGEEYRQELRAGLERQGDEIRSLPWGAGSGFRGGPHKGHFFCAKVGDRLFLRFVPSEGGALTKETLACLKSIACTANTERYLAQEMHNCAYDAWERARRDIFNEWSFATDPANLQPKVSPTLREAANHLRKFPPPGLTQEKVDRLTDSIEAPWGKRYEKQIRDAMRSASGGTAASTAIAEKVRELGLEPFKAPEPLPPIEENEVRLVCWMAIET